MAAANGKSTPQACKEAEITTQLREECLHGEIFHSLKEAQMVVGARGYLRIKPPVLERDPGAMLGRGEKCPRNLSTRVCRRLPVSVHWLNR